jgi:ATP-binding cassette, subfamily C, bacteriocin exporter
LKKHRLTQLPVSILQQDQKDCGIACLLSVIRYYGGDTDVEQLRRLSGTSVTGTTLLGLYQAAQAMGFDAEGCEADITALLAHTKPCILHVTLEGGLQHYVVYYGSTNYKGTTRITLADPAKGIVHITPEELLHIWLSKVCLVLTPNEGFVKRDIAVKAQRRWLLLLVHPDFSLLGIAALLGIAMAALGLTMALFSQRLIDEFLPSKQYHKLFTGIALVFLLLVAKEVLAALRSHLLIRQSKTLTYALFSRFFLACCSYPKHFLKPEKPANLLHDSMIPYAYNGYLHK